MDGIPISIDNLRVRGIQIRAGKYERDVTCTDPEHCLLAMRGGTNCATSFMDENHNVYCPSVRGNTGWFTIVDTFLKIVILKLILLDCRFICIPISIFL